MIYTLTLNPALDRELTVPEIVFDDVLRANNLRLDYGGKGFNVSRALAALGEESVAVGFVGGTTGQIITNGLSRLEIPTDFVPIAGETRTNISIVSQSQSNYVKVNEVGPIISAEAQKALMHKVSNLAKKGDWWVLSGSLPPGVPATFYADIIQTVQSAGAKTILDTSGAALSSGCKAAPFLAKPNASEARELTGIKQVVTNTQAVTGAIHQLGVQNILISMGQAGAMLSDGNTLWLAHPPEIEERNPIGAGDSSVAGLVWALAHQLNWPDALRWSMACGAATAALSGTAVGSKEEVELLTGQVEVIRL